MYLTLLKGNILEDILTMNWLKLHQIEFVYKNQYFFVAKQVYEDLQKRFNEEIVLQNIEMADIEVTYHTVVNRLTIGMQKADGIFAGYRACEYQPLKTFAVPESGYYAKGNVVTLYFETPKVATPLDIIWASGTKLSFKQKYYAILFDYLPLEDKIIYQILFHFNSDDIQLKLSEILQTKEFFQKLDLKQVQSGVNQFPMILNQFQKLNLQGQSANELENIQFTGATVFMPEEEEILEQVHALICG